MDNHLDEKSQLIAAYIRERKHAPFTLIPSMFSMHHTFLLIANHYHPYNQFMLLLPPSVAKREPESSELIFLM